MWRQEFERDRPLQLDVLRLIDHSHPALAELAKNPVMRNGSAYHCGVRPSIFLSIIAPDPHDAAD
jgi:hypothetical protein